MKRIKNILRHNTPVWMRPMLHIPEFKNELLNFYNIKKANGKNQSVLFFTTHKCASVGMKKLLPYLLSENYIFQNIDGFIAKYFQKEVEIEYSNFRIMNMFKNEGYVYAPLRKFQKIENMSSYKVILFLRDPIDVLVSHYHSVTKSHGVINKKLIIDREKAKEQDIDDFSIEYSNAYEKIYSDYKNMMISNNVLQLGYSEFINNPSEFSSRICNYLELDITKSTLDLINKEFMISKLDKGGKSHIRSGMTGTGRKELKLETIIYLEAKFKHFTEEFKF